MALSTLNIDPVRRDTIRHLNRLDESEAEAQAREDLTSQRYDELTTNFDAFKELTEYSMTGGPRLDQALFNLLQAWSKKDPEKTITAACRVCSLLDSEATEMAEFWAENEMERIEEESAAA